MGRIELLQASVDLGDEDSELRILVDGKDIKYLTVKAGVYDPDDMSFGPVITTILPPLPDEQWISGTIARHPSTDKPYFLSINADPLPGVKYTWHQHCVEYLQLLLGERLRSNVYRAYDAKLGKNVVVKFARFPWEIYRLDRETEAYHWISGQLFSPYFLGHVTEDGRVIGFVMEDVTNNRRAGPEDLALCKEVLTKLHGLNILHGDVNRHNFLIGNGRAILIDFDLATKCADQDRLDAELNLLEAELRDESGKGGYVV